MTTVPQQEPGVKAVDASGSEPAKKKRKPTKKTPNSEVSFENTFDDKKVNAQVLSFKVRESSYRTTSLLLSSTLDDQP
jgi:hypothetical protein